MDEPQIPLAGEQGNRDAGEETGRVCNCLPAPRQYHSEPQIGVLDWKQAHFLITATRALPDK